MSFLDALIAFLFGTGEPESNIQLGLVFSTTCALAFIVFVAIDFLRFLIGKLGMARGRGGLNIEHGWKTAVYVVLGAGAAWLVGLVAHILEVFQAAPLSAVAVGVTWEFVFDRLIRQVEAQARDATAPVDGEDEFVQPEFEEQEE